MKPIFVKVGSCVMLEDKTVVKCVEDVDGFSCSLCAFNTGLKNEAQCDNFACTVEERGEHPPAHFKLISDTCDRCGREVIEGDAVCEGCKIEELSNLF